MEQLQVHLPIETLYRQLLSLQYPKINTNDHCLICVIISSLAYCVFVPLAKSQKNISFAVFTHVSHVGPHDLMAPRITRICENGYFQVLPAQTFTDLL